MIDPFNRLFLCPVSAAVKLEQMLVFSLSNGSRVVCWNNCCRKIQKGKKKSHLKLFYEISTSCRSLWSSSYWFTKSVSIFRRFKCVRFNFKCLQSADSKEWKSKLAVTFLERQFSSVAQSCLTLWDPMDCSTPGFPIHHQLPELAQTHVHRVSDAIQPSHLILCQKES